MLVANSFDLWQKDAFFAAAEEVQQSTDIMESAYRSWLKARKEGLIPLYLDELSRELQMALGTAKWQLEEFERAVGTSYKNSVDEVTISRHKQFVSVIQDQISRVETALKDSYDAEGKKPFRWVDLDEEEYDDFAHFLSGTSQRTKDDDTELSSPLSSTKDNNTSDYSSSDSKASSKLLVPNQRKIEHMSCSVNLEDSKFQITGDDLASQEAPGGFAGNSSNWDYPQRTALEIVIDRDDRQENAIIEATPKEKGSRPFINGLRGNHHLSRIGSKITNYINLLRRRNRSQRQYQQFTSMLPVNSICYVLILMLTIFLVVPFLVYTV